VVGVENYMFTRVSDRNISKWSRARETHKFKTGK